MSAVPAIEHLVILTDREREYLVRAIESAIHVRKRHQFFLWAQGQLRGVLPHQILVCIRLDGEGQVLQLECFHGTVLAGDDYERLCNPFSGYAVQLARECCAAGPLLLGEMATAEAGDAAAGLLQNGLRNALACATGPVLGGNSVYLLFDLDADPDHRHVYFLELLLPQLQMAVMRLAESQAHDPDPQSAIDIASVTAREVEILRLVQHGKSNQDIAEALGISALTVKNHTQKIYRKLKVQNRAHAVSRGIELRLLDFAVN